MMSHLETDTLSSNLTNTFQAQLCRVNCHLDEVQKEFHKSKEEHGEGFLEGSPFVQDIQDKLISSNFRLPMLEAYNDSFDLAEHIGYLKRYVKRPQEPSLCSNGPTEKQIDIIIKESTFNGDSAFSRKVYAQAIMEKCPEQKDEPEITFEAEETEYPDNDDALVVSVRITNARVKRGMVETRSSIDILYFDTFQKLRLIVTNLLPMSSTLTGFTVDSITPFETTILPVTVK
ncbi:hypothetical protein GW17_00038476 [Ensete ventricosum]|nr:hypothetical protein GW17_00038476 [Ensete ventricosum]